VLHGDSPAGTSLDCLKGLLKAVKLNLPFCVCDCAFMSNKAPEKLAFARVTSDAPSETLTSSTVLAAIRG
jgi:hypothetical protein